MSESNEIVPEVDPLMVPSQAAWDAMTALEQVKTEEKIISALEQEFNLMGETTAHFDTRAESTEVLRRFFKGQGRSVFVASDLHTLYPNERAFYPDLMVVFDVDNHDRSSWNVLREGKGLDFVLEVLSKETKRKDRVEKLNLYARLKIPEYFMFDPQIKELSGFRWSRGSYVEIPKKDNCYVSKTLGLRIQIDVGKLRFASVEGIDVPFADELVEQLNRKLDSNGKLVEEYARIAEEERQGREEERQAREEEQQRADALEQQLNQEKQEREKERLEAEAELARLRALLEERN